MNMFAYQYIVFPMVTLVLLTFIVLILMFRSRTAAVKSGSMSAGFFKTYVGDGEPEQSRKLSRHFTNLFEAPVLFYVVCIGALSLQQSYGLFQILAWFYVLLRIVHAFVHLGKNKLPQRIGVYFASWIILLGLWILLSYRVIAGG